jgi:hypothetical protein
MRQFMMTVTALAVFGAMVVTAQAEKQTETLSAAPSTCTGMKSVCLLNNKQQMLRFLRQNCTWEFGQCMKSGWWHGTRGAGVSHPVERR